VLADELESITEPGASARIIAGILEYLSRNEQSLGVFVSHLSELILENTGTEVRVDGIEADGLDSNLELIVNRNPVYNLIARSTPADCGTAAQKDYWKRAGVLLTFKG